MIYKRAIPRLATAALTLGGATVSGCGDGDATDGDPLETDPVESFCGKIAGCYEYGGEYVDYCVDQVQQDLSYYDAACQRTIRRVLGCFSNLSCDELYYGDFSSCYDELYAAYDDCPEFSYDYGYGA